MDKKYGLLVLCSLILLACFVGSVSGRTWYVDDDGAANFTRIQDAIDNATAGDTIIVSDGTYVENVDVYVDNVTIRSVNGSDFTIVQAANASAHVFEVSADYVNISGFTVKQVRSPSGFASAIVLVGVKDCEISGNNINFSSHGIALVNSKNNLVKDNTVKNTATGISLRDSSNYNIIRNNILNMNNFGVSLYELQYDIGSDENTITYNPNSSNFRE
jgi:nitrous oxidase accessory protein